MTNIAWIDVETSGLDYVKDELLEIAVLVTDENLNILDDEGFHSVIYHTPGVVARLRRDATPIVQEMHTKTGLWDKLETEGRDIYEVDKALADYLRPFNMPGRYRMPVGGNSVRFDQNFVQRQLPAVWSELDYHARDVSSLAGFMDDWFGTPAPEKASDHTAMTDIRECIREARYYRGVIEGWRLASEPALWSERTRDDIAMRLEAQATWVGDPRANETRIRDVMNEAAALIRKERYGS